METIVVASPTPQPSTPGGINPTENTGDDNSFAPTLAEAISKKDISKKDESNSPHEQKEHSETSPETPELVNEAAEDSYHSSISLIPVVDASPITNQKLVFRKGLIDKTAIPEIPELVSSQSKNEKISASLQTPITGSKPHLIQQLDSKSLSTLNPKDLTQVTTLNIPQSEITTKTVQTSVKLQLSGSANLSDFTKTNTTSTPVKLQSESTESFFNILSPNAKDTIKWTTSTGNASNNPSKYIPHSNFSSLNINNEKTVKSPKFSISTENIIANLTDLPLETEVPKSTLRNNSSIRHDINGQYLDAKIQKSSLNVEQQTGQQQLDTKEDPASQSQLLASSAKPLNSSGESVFPTTVANILAENPDQQITSSAKPILSSLSTPVYDDDIMLQVIQKFRSTPQLLNNKLVMKLHPAELGDMKVDIQLKGGTINANIVVQSQQVLEILEKNMPKLRNLIEQQGVTIGDITVKLDSDVLADYNLFQQQFSNEEKSSSFKKSAKSPESFDLSLEDTENEKVTPKSGVNVKV